MLCCYFSVEEEAHEEVEEEEEKDESKVSMLNIDLLSNSDNRILKLIPFFLNLFLIIII